jgi:hypothetical protein
MNALRKLGFVFMRDAYYVDAAVWTLRLAGIVCGGYLVAQVFGSAQ